MKIRRVEDTPAGPVPCFELIADSEAGSIIAFRVELKDRVVSFARDEIRRWALHLEEPQRLLVHIGHDLVVSVVGNGLSALHEALDRDRLLTIRCSKQSGEQGPSIKSIELVARAEPVGKP